MCILWCVDSVSKGYIYIRMGVGLCVYFEVWRQCIYKWYIEGISEMCVYCGVYTVIIITQTAAIALEPLTTHPDEWAEPSHK